MAERLYTTTQAASELGVTPGRVRQMVIDGEIAAQKFGRDLMISASAIMAAKKRKTTPGPAPKMRTKPLAKKAARNNRRKQRK
jgi:excisionase family DNA binding protein